MCTSIDESITISFELPFSDYKIPSLKIKDLHPTFPYASGPQCSGATSLFMSTGAPKQKIWILHYIVNRFRQAYWASKPY